MRIPRIDSSYRPRETGTRQIAPSPLEGVASGLLSLGVATEALAQDRLRDLKEEERANQTIIENSYQNQMYKLQTSMLSNVDTASDYATYRNKWQAESEKIIGEFEKTKGLDKNFREVMIGNLRRSQLENDFRIGQQVQQRRKREVAASADASVGNAIDAAVKGETDIQTAMQKIGSAYGGAAGVGAIEQASVKGRAQDALGKIVQARVGLMVSEKNIEGAQKIIDETKGSLDGITYASLQSSLNKTRETMSSAAVTGNFIASQGATKAPEQKDIDAYYQENVIKDLQDGNIAVYQTKVVEIADATGKLPSGVKSQATAYLNTYKENMSDQEIQTVAMNAQMVADVGYRGKSGFSQDTVAKADLIAARMNAGMSQREAVQSTLLQKNDKVYQEVFARSQKELSKKIGDDPEFITDTMGLSSNNNMLNKEFGDLYSLNRANGASDSEAIDATKKQLSKSYSEFNGQTVKLSPTAMTRFNDEESWISAAKAVASKYVRIPDDAKVILSGDDTTQRQITAGFSDTELSFPVIMQTGGVSVPVYRPDGTMLRIKADPKFKVKTGKSFLDRYAEVLTRD